MTPISPPLLMTSPAEDDAAPEGRFASNEVRLSPGQWVVAASVLVVLAFSVPAVWKRIEPIQPGPDYRVPFPLSDDYWLVQRSIAAAAAEQKTLVIGDSVIWGHYVGKAETLSHYLNELGGEDRFLNLGVDGIHPAALVGLLEHYGGDVAGRDVVLHCNFLWISSPRHDLTTEKEFSFNHPTLVPQFFPRIPCYKESFAGRLANVVRREVPLLGWASHLEIAYFGNTDLPLWTIEHPYQNPAAAVTLKLPSPDEPPSPEPIAKPWTEQGITKFNPPWVELKTSIQWQSFRRTIEILRRRKNRVFVLVGPFNEHMLTDESYAVYQERKREAGDWLRQNGVLHYVPPPLPSLLYADASHPLAEGYRVLARELLQDAQFRQFQSKPQAGPGVAP